MFVVRDDGQQNLVGAAKVAMTDLGEIAIAMHETTNDENVAIWRGTRVRKAHSSKRNAFVSPNEGPLGIVRENVEMNNKYRSLTDETKLEAGFEDEIALV